MADFTMFDLKVTDGVAVATFNRPDKMEYVHAGHDARADRAVRRDRCG